MFIQSAIAHLPAAMCQHLKRCGLQPLLLALLKGLQQDLLELRVTNLICGWLSISWEGLQNFMGQSIIAVQANRFLAVRISSTALLNVTNTP